MLRRFQVVHPQDMGPAGFHKRGVMTCEQRQTLGGPRNLMHWAKISRAWWSSPLLGSSSSITCGSPIQAALSMNFFCVPSDMALKRVRLLLYEASTPPANILHHGVYTSGAKGEPNDKYPDGHSQTRRGKSAAIEASLYTRVLVTITDHGTKTL